MDEELTSVTGNEVDDMTQDYLTTIKELKQNSVDKSKYDQLRLENKRLLDSIVNGQEIDLPKQEDKKSIETLRQELFNNEDGLSNLEFIKDTLDLREQLIQDGKPDPFLPIGNQIAPTDFDIQTANKVAQVLQECVDYADGDSSVFTNELMRRTLDVKVRL